MYPHVKQGGLDSLWLVMDGGYSVFADLTAVPSAL